MWSSMKLRQAILIDLRLVGQKQLQMVSDSLMQPFRQLQWRLLMLLAIMQAAIDRGMSKFVSKQC